MITPTADLNYINALLNNPAVRPWIADMGEGHIDLSEQYKSGRMLVLRGEHGAFIVYRLDAGIWETHTFILPAGRGSWSREFAQHGFKFMFCNTDAVEVLTRVPAPHDAARKLSLDSGFRLQFTTLPETKFRGGLVPVEVYSRSLQDWARDVPDMEEHGEAFHQWLNGQVGRGEPHQNDPAHNRTVGIVLEMLRGGQVMKGIVWYNRWAVEARHPMISLVSPDPLRIRFDAGILELDDDGAISYAVSH